MLLLYCYLTCDGFVINNDYKLAYYYNSLDLSSLIIDRLLLGVKILVISQVSESTFVAVIMLEEKFSAL